LSHSAGFIFGNSASLMFYISGDTMHPKGKTSDVSSVNASVKAANRERIVHNLLKLYMVAFIRA
jgi:hypothetical protein